ncbi:MAG: M20/M25/M40 family metallo-hydrolase [Bdellovibrionales bacterium]|nr:M20/M25/M40 family metallo-hydrolase [Bdellovibrionales bacterium]
MNFIETCRKAISIDSSQSHGNGDLAVYFGELCREAGLYVEFHDEVLNGLSQKNLVAKTLSSANEFEFILQTPIDTADPGIYAFWTKTEQNPFNASIYGDDLFGLGTSRCKLDFLCKLEAIKEIGVKNIKHPIALVATYGELTGMAGAIKLIRKTKLKSKRALIGGVTGNRLVTGSVGLAKVEITVPFTKEEIEARHQHDVVESSSSQSKIFYKNEEGLVHLNKNPIVHMVNFLENLPQGIVVLDIDGGLHYNTTPETAYLEFDLMGGFENSIIEKIGGVIKSLVELERHFHETPIEGYEPPFTPMNLGSIRTFRDHVKLEGCCKITSEIGEKQYESWMNQVKESCDGYDANFLISEYKKPFFTNPESEFFSSAKLILADVKNETLAKKISYTTEASVFSRLGTECLIFGPGEYLMGEQQANEMVRISRLNEAVNFYKMILERYVI